MKNLKTFSICMLCSIMSVQAQQVFNVQNGTRTEFYNSLETAMQNAVAGDTIYLPAGAIQLQNDLVIDKKLAIIGVGWDIDSIGGLLPTIIRKGTGYADIIFKSGCNGSLLHGCELGAIYFGKSGDDPATQNIQNVTISRNRLFGAINLGFNETNNNNCLSTISNLKK